PVRSLHLPRPDIVSLAVPDRLRGVLPESIEGQPLGFVERELAIYFQGPINGRPFPFYGEIIHLYLIKPALLNLRRPLDPFRPFIPDQDRLRAPAYSRLDKRGRLRIIAESAVLARRNIDPLP